MDGYASPWLVNEDVPMRRNRSWSGLSSMGSSLKTLFGGKKTLPRSSSSNQICPNHESESAWGDRPVFMTTNSATPSDFSDALTIQHEEVPDTEVDPAAANISEEVANNEVESAVSDCAGAPPSEMLHAFASVESWGRSAGEKGTDHYGAGYQTRVGVSAKCE